ncbi:hypothetical protein [Ectothiorhodospira shaposhnikovii]|uniref:hypothetical protein n=1 Tax=Ectothiorhodospira shaposhnikovii TaxID=1054 RepID=UPI0039A202FD
MGNTLPGPHDTLFMALLEDPERAGALLRESLPKALTDKMAGDPRQILIYIVRVHTMNSSKGWPSRAFSKARLRPY